MPKACSLTFTPYRSNFVLLHTSNIPSIMYLFMTSMALSNGKISRKPLDHKDPTLNDPVRPGSIEVTLQRYNPTDQTRCCAERIQPYKLSETTNRVLSHTFSQVPQGSWYSAHATESFAADL